MANDISDKIFPCGNCGERMKATIKEKTDKDGATSTTYLFTCKCGRKVEIPEGDMAKKKVISEGKESKKAPILEPEENEPSLQDFMESMNKQFGRM